MLSLRFASLPCRLLLREIVDPILENVSNEYKLGLAVLQIPDSRLQVRETGTPRTFGDRT
jgi:hypothetical protein